MNTEQEMKDIQDQIHTLQQKQSEIRDKQKFENIAEIRKMEWLKGKTVRFDHGMMAVGLAEYKISLVDNIPLLNSVLIGYRGHVCLYGDHPFYENNIILRKGDDWGLSSYTMETSNGETLMRFIEENGLKIKVSKDRQAVYKAILGNLAD